MLTFGYESDLQNIGFKFQQQIEKRLFLVSQISENEEYKFARNKFLRNLSFKEYDQLNNETKEEDQIIKDLNFREYRIISQFYAIGDNITRMIIIYVLFKLKFLAGKTLILVKSLDEIFKFQLFLDRIGIPAFQIYNHEDPKNVKYYTLSIFNTGVISVLVATPQILKDLQSKIFYSKQRKVIQFKNLDNIVVLDILNVDYKQLYRHFRGSEGNIVSCVENKDQEILKLTQVIENQRAEFGDKINIKEFPLTRAEIDAFRYRITDVANGISQKQIQAAKNLDFKKKMLKSQDLKEYFEKNPTEQEQILEEIQKYSQ